MQAAFIRKGHGYTSPSPGSGYEPCTAFDGFTVIANPLGGFSNADRERRVFSIKPGGETKVTYGSHAISLAYQTCDGERASRDLFILMENGSGREVLRVRNGISGNPLEAMLLALPEALLYSLLYTLWDTANDARNAAETATAIKWRDAFLDGRIRKSRPRGGYFRVTVESEFERDLRTGKAKPGRIAIDVASGEARQA